MIEPKYAYVCLLDILGYRAFLENDREKGSLAFAEKLEEAFKVFDGHEARYRTQIISDTIITTCPEHSNFPDFLNYLRKIFSGFLSNGLFVRGGVAYSRHFSEGIMTYSHALARAYEIEQEIAIHPRVVIDSNIISMYDSGTDLPVIYGQDLIYRQNEVAFLNVVSSRSVWTNFYQKAKQIYEDANVILEARQNYFIKHLWFQEFLFSSKHKDPEAQRYITQIIEV